MLQTLPTTKESIFQTHFQKLLIAITVIAFLVRLVNITYASLWSDELYSMLSVHPDNSIYEMLYMQRKDQAPLYFVVLRVWTTIFGFTDVSARALSILIGVLSVYCIGLVNKKIFNAQVGILAAFITAFSFTQIEHSLEARFYGLLFLLITISIYTYFLVQKKPSWQHIFFHAVVCALVMLQHQFGALVILVYGLFDLGSLLTKFSWASFKSKALLYLLTVAFIFPWYYWSFTAIKTVSDYWLKVIDLPAYLLYNLKYSLPILAIIVVASAAGFYLKRKQLTRIEWVLFCQVLIVVGMPFAFSYIKFPILVPRYSFAMAPALYILLAIGIVALIQRVKLPGVLVTTVLVLLFSINGLYASFVNKEQLMKEPWREMAAWLQKQPDYETASIFSSGYYLRKRFTLDYYLPNHKVKHIYDDTTGITKYQKFYLVETNGHDIAPASVKDALNLKFKKEEIQFGKNSYGKGGVISIYTKPKS